MKLSTWRAERGIHTDLEEREYFRRNMYLGFGPVAIVCCLWCKEVLGGETGYEHPEPKCAEWIEHHSKLVV